MATLLIVILDDLERLQELMAAWKRVGVPGVTLLQSFGGYRTQDWLHRISLGGIGRLFDQGQIRQRTLLSLIDDEKLLERAISEADEVVGGFDRPHSGILFTIPVGNSLGLQKWDQEKAGVVDSAEKVLNSSGQVKLSRNTPVADIVSLLSLEPAVVSVDDPLETVLDALFLHPTVQVVCVVNETKRLVGLIDMTTLANALFQLIFPEEFLGMTELEQVLRYAERSHSEKAADLMKEPAWLRPNNTLREAFHLVHERGLTGVPVVDEHYHITGYINLLELMVACLNRKPNPPEESEKRN